ncbi:MAG: ion channel, partial [Gemmatimonadota bacterium]
MPRLSRSYRRILLLLLALPVILYLLALLYQAGMFYLEGKPRTILESLEWASETLTTTGYGRDSGWLHPLMQFFVILVQLAGVFLVFVAFQLFMVPFFEERFEQRIPPPLPAR